LAQQKNIDVFIGAKIRSRRIMLGISQAKLAERLGVTFQQIQKYESGANSLNSVRIYGFCEVLQISVEQLFNGFSKTTAIEDKGLKINASERESLEIMKSFNKIKNPVIRKRIADFIRSVEST